jgi:hypothetical protein
MDKIALFPKHTQTNHGRCLAALLRASVETVETGKGLCKKKKSKRRGTAHKVQSKRKHGFSTASTMIGAHIEYYANLRTLAFQNGKQARIRKHWLTAPKGGANGTVILFLKHNTITWLPDLNLPHISNI